MANRQVILAEDLNGQCFILGGSGEVMDDNPRYTVYIPPGRPNVWIPGTKWSDYAATATAETTQAARFFLENVFWINYDMLGNAIHGADMNQLNRLCVAYIRMLGVREGLIDEREMADNHRCRYNNAKLHLTRDMLLRTHNGVNGVAIAIGALTDDLADVAELWLNTENNKHDANHQIYIRPVDANDQAAWGAITPEIRATIRTDFTDAVCLLAYMFRVRGHHFLDEMENRYGELWEKCLKGRNKLVGNLPWKLVVCEGLHAIFPDTLDGYWRAQRTANQIAGALYLRFDSYPAGCASVAALRAGFDDLVLAMPGFAAKLEEVDRRIKTYEDLLSANRWGGSINHNLYGATKVTIVEKEFAAISAFILAALKALAPRAPLVNSAALKRMAANAPITGAVMAIILQNLISDKDEMKNILHQINV